MRREKRRKQPRTRNQPHTKTSLAALAAVAVALEVEVEVEDAALEARLEAALVRVLPLAVDDLEGELLVPAKIGWCNRVV